MPLTQKGLYQSLQASGKERVTDTSEGFRTFLADQCPGPFKAGGMIFGNFWRNLGLANSQVQPHWVLWSKTQVLGSCWLWTTFNSLYIIQINNWKVEKNLSKLNKLGCRIQQNMILPQLKCSEPLEMKLLELFPLFHQILVNMAAQPCNTPKMSVKGQKIFLPPATWECQWFPSAGLNLSQDGLRAIWKKKKKAGIWGSDPWCDSDMPMILSVSSIQHKRRKWGRKIKCLLSDTAGPWEMGWY